MKKIALLACALLLVGCGASPSETIAATSDPSANATTAKPAVRVTEAATCQTLVADDGGLVSDSAAFLTGVTELSDETAGEAESLANELQGVADTSSDRLSDLLIVMQEPLRDLVTAQQTTGTFDLDASRFKAAGNELLEICGPLLEGATTEPTADREAESSPAADAPAEFAYSCRAGGVSGTEFSSYKEVWAHSEPVDICTAEKAAGTVSEAEIAAAEAAYSPGNPDEKVAFLYQLCATTAGHYVENAVSEGQAAEIEAALTLCPDHPKAEQMRANAVAGKAEAADRAAGKMIGPGKYLVGTDIVPGTWQSQGEKVEDCYWEISDAQGNILENNFISISPQFTIYIPPTAAGFTAERCSFRWISG